MAMESSFTQKEQDAKFIKPTQSSIPTPLFETFQAASIASITSQSGTVSLPGCGVDLTNLMEMIENTLIIQALERTGNNKNQAAKLLGLNRTTLVERLKKRRLGFKDEEPILRK